MDAKALVFGDVEREMAVTRRVLEALPAEHFAWKPHEKSMSLMGLGLHVATLPGWLRDSLKADVLDFAEAPRPPASVASTAELVALFDETAASMRGALAAFDMANWEKVWTIDAQYGHDPFAERGVSPDGAIVVVRPDQYVAEVLPLTARAELGEFFAGFLREPAGVAAR